MLPTVLAVLGAAGLLLAAVALYLAANWAPDRPVGDLQARWAPPPSAFLAIDGMQVHVRDEGPGADPTPIVLIHGTGSSLHAWDGWTARLAERRRVIRFDRPGFGLTGPNPTGDYSMAYYAGFVVRLLDALGVRRCVLVGSSSGGRVAWNLALARPDRVAGLVLVAPAGYPRSTPFPLGLRIAQSRPLAGLFAHVLPRGMIRRNLRRTFGDPGRVTPEVVDRTYEITLRAGNRRALGATLAQAAALDNSAAIGQVRAPTLILWGDRDAVIPPADAARFHAAIAGSRLVILPGLGHMPYEEDPTGSLVPVEAFLAALPGGA